MKTKYTQVPHFLKVVWPDGRTTIANFNDYSKFGEILQELIKAQYPKLFKRVRVVRS